VADNWSKSQRGKQGNSGHAYAAREIARSRQQFRGQVLLELPIDDWSLAIFDPRDPGHDVFDRVHSVKLTSCKPSTELLQNLGWLDQLKLLGLSQSQVGDAELEHLQRLTKRIDHG
jgi:hypothetical protein